MAATQAGGARDNRYDEFADEAQAYKDLSLHFLENRPPRLIAMGGLSGAGKSTLAAGIAGSVGAPPARILSSDGLRKKSYGVSAQTRLPAEAYLPTVSRQVYAMMAEQARSIPINGHAVIADATFEEPDDRHPHRAHCGEGRRTLRWILD